MARKLYDPQLSPERDILKIKKEMLEEQRGTFRVRRHGEQYICSCICAATLITSDTYEQTNFWKEHRPHAGETQTA